MEIAEGIEYLHIYWVRGSSPKGAQHRSEVQDPPCSGWQHALVLRGERRSTIFCPFTMTAYQVSNRSAEMMSASPPRGSGDRERIVRIITDNWAQYQSFGWMRDYDTAALILRKLDAPVPEQLLRGGEKDTRKKGGKEVAKALAKPVKKEGKRGQFLQWFLEGGGSRSVREAMAHFSMTRSNALSYLFMLKKDHGIGYELVGDMATVVLPEGCVDPFTSQEEQDAAASAHNPCAEQSILRPQPGEEPELEAADDDDSWLN